jgi:hypothetical protein
MSSCARWASGAVVATLVFAAVCQAAEPSYEPGRAGIGGLIGGSTFRLDRMLGTNRTGDYSEGAQTRFSFSGHFRYVVNPWLRWQVSPGFTWCGYKGSVPAPMIDPRAPDDPDKGDYLTLLLPVSAQLQYVVKRGWWLYHVGAGPGVYRIIVENHRHVLKDPVTFRNHRGLYPGASGQIGVERFLKGITTTSIEVALAGHVAFAKRNDQFVSGINNNLVAAELLVGVNYYFSLSSKPKAPEPSPTPEQ